MNHRKIIILNYHLILRESAKNSRPNHSRFTVSEQEFLNQMNLLKELEIPVVPLSQIASTSYTHEFAVALSFDDGNNSDFTIVYPILKHLNFSAAFFPVTSAIGTPGKLSWEKLKELSAEFIIGSHGLTHTALTQLPSGQIELELLDSKMKLENKLGVAVKYFAVPFGEYNKEVIRLAKAAGYSSILSTHSRPNVPQSKHFILHRMNIKSNTLPNRFEDILLQKGIVSKNQLLYSLVAESGKRILGHKLSHNLGSFLNTITK